MEIGSRDTPFAERVDCWRQPPDQIVDYQTAFRVVGLQDQKSGLCLSLLPSPAAATMTGASGRLVACTAATSVMLVDDMSALIISHRRYDHRSTHALRIRSYATVSTLSTCAVRVFVPKV